MTYVVFSTPCLTHNVAMEFNLSSLRTQKLLLENGVAHEWSSRTGDPFIAKARSSAVCEFLKTDASDLFFLDDDIGWPCEAVLRFLQSDVPVIAGVYPHKLDELSFPCSLEAGPDGLVERDGLVRAVLAPTGFMRIKRWVLETLYQTAPAYRELESDGVWHERRAIFVDGPGSDGNWWGEDYTFCNACHLAGIDIWIDPDIPFYHRGTKRYAARMSDSMEVFRTKAKQVNMQSSGDLDIKRSAA